VSAGRGLARVGYGLPNNTRGLPVRITRHGFEANDEGQIERTGIAEDVESEVAAVAALLILGRGKRTKTTSTRYNTLAWEQH
jgi:hypothetical protein